MAAQISFGPRFQPRTAPVTFWLIIAAAGLLLGGFLLTGSTARLAALVEPLVYAPAALADRPWSLLTWPLVNLVGPFWFLLLGYILWWVGSDLERWWGSRVQLGFALAVTLASAAALGLLARLVPDYALVTLAGVEPLLCAWFCVWALRQPRATVLLLIIPVPAWLIAVLAVLSLLFSLSLLPGLAVALGSAGLGAAYFRWGEHYHRLLRRLQPRGAEQRRRDKRFRRLMKRSGLHLVDDDPPR